MSSGEIIKKIFVVEDISDFPQLTMMAKFTVKNIRNWTKIM